MNRFEFARPMMGTRARVVLYAKSQPAAEAAADAAFARMYQLNLILSDYRPESELSRLNATAGTGQAVHVGDDLFNCIAAGQSLAERTGGAFDMTVGPLVQLWRTSRKEKKLPDAATLAAARAASGYGKLRLDPATRQITLTVPGMKLDAGGIAKGYAAEEACKVLKARGIENALIALGGDLFASGAPPGKPAWRVGVGVLDDPNQIPTRFIALTNAGVSTSGDYEQHVEIDGVRYAHIVDPHTGLGLRGRVSATVTAPRGLDSDTLTKALCVLGPEKGIAFIETISGAAALVVWKDEAGVERNKASCGWREIEGD